MMTDDDFKKLPLDEQFAILLHKKIMNKQGGAKRRAKKYYMDLYRKSGVIPKPLILAGQGIMEGRKCSGRRRSLTGQIKKRFIEMVIASTDHSDERFIFVTRRARTINNYHIWLEQEFGAGISLSALRYLARQADLRIYLKMPDFEDETDQSTCFKDVAVFELVQMDGCKFRYVMIRSSPGSWAKPWVIESFDTGSRYMFTLEGYFSESSENSVHLFSQLLKSTPFPKKKIGLRPDHAKGFINLKRPINELNIKYSTPGGFHLKPDFSRVQAPKDKAHLESSHRALHHFEIQVVKHFEDRIVKHEPGYIFINGKKEKITVTYLDIDLETLRRSGLLESYRRQHNEQKHYFSVNGETMPWIPAEKLQAALERHELLSIKPEDIRHLAKYGYDKIRATVSKSGIITFRNQTYHVVDGAEKFSRQKGTKVHVSVYNDKLFIFERKENGVLLGEALRRKPFERPPEKQITCEPNAVERISDYLREQKMVVDRLRLIEIHHGGLTLDIAKAIYAENRVRYAAYSIKLKQPDSITGTALFNAFILDCERRLSASPVVEYARCSRD